MDPVEALGLRVRVSVAGEVLTIPCGDGSQTVRWLATVAAQRYTQMHVVSGRGRQRECVASPAGAFLPSNVVARVSGVMLGPTLTVKQALEGCAADEYKSTGGASSLPLIAVELLQASELAADGSFKTPTWSALAFKCSEGGRALASQLLAADEANAVAAVQEHERREEADATVAMRSFVAELDLITSCNDRIRSDEFAKRPWPVLRVSLVSDDKLEQFGLRRAVMRRFQLINDVFRYLSSEALASEVLFSLAYSELRHFLDVCGVLQFPKDVLLLDRLIGQVVPPKQASQPRQFRFSCVHLIEVLLLVAKARFMSERKSDGSVTHVDSIGAFERLVDGFVALFVSKFNLGPIRALLRSEQVHRLLPRVAPFVHAAVEYYSNILAPSTDDTHMCLSAPALAKLLQHSQLLDLASLGATGDVTDAACLREAKKVCEAVQEHSPLDGSVGLRRLGDVPLMTELVLSEVVEAVVCAGVTRWASVEVSDTAKACRAIQVLAQLGESPGTPLSAYEVTNAFEGAGSSALGLAAGAGAGAGHFFMTSEASAASFD